MLDRHVVVGEAQGHLGVGREVKLLGVERGALRGDRDRDADDQLLMAHADIRACGSATQQKQAQDHHDRPLGGLDPVGGGKNERDPEDLCCGHQRDQGGTDLRHGEQDTRHADDEDADENDGDEREAERPEDALPELLHHFVSSIRFSVLSTSR